MGVRVDSQSPSLPHPSLLLSVDPTGEFSKHGFRSSEAALRKEMKFVHQETQQKLEKLVVATDSQIGLELLHMFVLDLLGRNTPAAKIFLTKSSAE
jgi:hypothetical protein